MRDFKLQALILCEINNWSLKYAGSSDFPINSYKSINCTNSMEEKHSKAM